MAVKNFVCKSEIDDLDHSNACSCSVAFENKILREYPAEVPRKQCWG